MPAPTLGQKGKLRAPNGDEKLQKELDEWVPYMYIIDWLKTRMYKTGIENRFMVLLSETASGKSTLLPAEILRHLVLTAGANSPGIICTQPRVLTAIENVKGMIYESGPDYPTFLKLGETIGWSTQNNKLKPKSRGLLSATIGTLAMQLKNFTDEEIMSLYKFILIDETHERDLNIDMTLYMLKNFLLRNANNPNCPFVILMSATFDPAKFIKYFGVTDDNFVWVQGRTYGIKEMWDWNEGRTVNDYPRAAATVVEKIIRENPEDSEEQADILIFMPGRAEFKETEGWLIKLNKTLVSDNLKPFSLLQLDSEGQRKGAKDFKLLYDPVANHKVVIGGNTYVPGRRVIISTNIAETGLTLTNLKYVIDAGMNKEIEFNPSHGIRSLLTKPAPKSRIKQRKGRAGRKFEGVFYPLYPIHIYNELQEIQYPQILVEDLSPVMLDIVREQLRTKKLNNQPLDFDLRDTDMIDQPTSEAVQFALEKIYALGFIDPGFGDEKCNLTALGNVVAEFGMIGMEYLRMIFAGYFWGCSIVDLITIAAYCSISARDFMDTKDPIKWSDIYKLGVSQTVISSNVEEKTRILFSDEFIDGCILMTALKHAISTAEGGYFNALTKWCLGVGLKLDTVLLFLKTRDDIIEQFLTNGINIFVNEEHSLGRSDAASIMTAVTKIKLCIYDGFKLNILTMNTQKNGYYAQGVEISTPTIFKGASETPGMTKVDEYVETVGYKPTNLLYNTANMKYNTKTNKYLVSVDRVSVMDGFVNIDNSYMQ